MASKAYKGPQTPYRIDGSETIRGWISRIALTQTYPGVRRRNQIAIEGDAARLYFYQRATSGRRCSCFVNNSTPSASCKNCFSTGIVGGYLKYGTSQVFVDVTYPGTRTIGLMPLTTNEGPDVWALEPGALQGSLEVQTTFEGCWGPVDYLGFTEWNGDNGLINWQFKNSSGLWTTLNNINLGRYLTKPQTLMLKMSMQRPGLEADSPVVVNAHLRILRRPASTLIVKADRPNYQRSFALSELGQLDEWTTASHWFDHTLQRITSDDWFYNLDETQRWKVVEVSRLAPLQYLLSWTATLRKVQDFEPIYNYPI